MNGSSVPALAVIIPAYNAEAYIENSVRSVLSQSYGELRLIVINDGSTDRSGEILARLAAEDDRLTLLSTGNAGPAVARNRAMALLDGETRYVMFMDADDELLPGAIEYAMNGAQGADLVLFGFSIKSPDGSERRYFEPEQRLDAAAMGEALPRLYKANLLNQVWGKLFSFPLIRKGGLSFPDYRWGEDRLFIFGCLERAERVAVLPECMYRYLMHPGESLITKYYDRKFQVCLEADRRVRALGEHFGVEDQRDLRYMFAKSVFSCLTTLYSPSCPLSGAEKREYARQIADSAYVRERCSRVFGGFAVNFLCAVLRSGSVTLILTVFCLVALAGRLAPGLFVKLKHRK